MTDIATQHRAEIDKGERFAFGKNWSRFLRSLNETKIAMAERSLRDFLGDIAGRSFVDIGSGSGLFSLAARRLGARVHSFDYDSDSYGCTLELKRRYFATDPDWVVEQGSALDKDYLGTLGTFDIVYSWGVLHHTGAMWEALDNVKPLVRIGGRLFIAIYNDQGAITDEWARIKAKYNSLPGPAALAYALGIIARDERRSLELYARNRDVRGWVSGWKDYGANSVRGMNRWHDWIDWIGGHPYERATVAAIVDRYSPDGFKLQKLVDRSNGIGCNEFLFERVAGPGTFVESPVPGGTSMARQFGRRVVGPFEQRRDGWWASISGLAPPKGGGHFRLLRRDADLGPAVVEDAGDELSRVRVAAADIAEAEVLADPYFILAAEVREVGPGFVHRGGHGWAVALSDLADRADSSEAPFVSDVYLFEDGQQIAFPHAMHHEIKDSGGGRFSHWGGELLFAPARVGEDPNANGRVYRLLLPSRTIGRGSSLAKRFGRRLDGVPERTVEGWTLPVALPPAEDGWILLGDDAVLGPLRLTADGRPILAGAASSRQLVAAVEYHAVDGREMPLPCAPARGEGLMWAVPLGEAEAGPSDTSEAPRRARAFVFQDGRQLPHPHAPHAEIAARGGGRFSYWGETLLFSTRNGEDPAAVNLTVIVPKGADVCRG